MAPRLSRATIGGVAQLLDLARGIGSVLRSGNFQSYSNGGQFSAYTGMWGKYLAQNDQLQATSSMRVYPGTFPTGTIFRWDVTPDPDWGGVNGYLAVSFGNYDDSPSTITPRQVKNITALAVDVGWSYAGDPASGLLAECWLSPVATPSGSPTRLHEVAFLPRMSPGSQDFAQGLPAVGSGSFTSGGVTWKVGLSTSGTGEPYYVAYRADLAAHQGVLPFRDYFAFLTAAGRITGDEWFNGLAFGVEPHHGAGSLVIERFAPTYS